MNRYRIASHTYALSKIVSHPYRVCADYVSAQTLYVPYIIHPVDVVSSDETMI